MAKKTVNDSSKEPPKESVEAARAKQLYVEMGADRSLVRLCTLLKRPEGYTRVLERWSSRYRWVEAAKAHDIDLIQKEAERQRKEFSDALEKLNKAHADVSFGLFVKVSKFLQELIDSKQLYGRDAVVLWKEAAVLHRLALGAINERLQVELSGNPDAPLIIEAIWGTGVVIEDSKDESDV